VNLPKHLAIIMDGNGRWAKARGQNRTFGHIRGAVVAKKIIEEAARIGLPHLTLFTFSTENWLRPETEVSFLMSLLFRRLRKERQTLIKNNIQFECIGDRSRLPAQVLFEVEETIRETAHCSGMKLIFALSYGGRQELTAAARLLAQQVKDGNLEPEEIDDATLNAALESSWLPHPDLIIRTSGEARLSNFFLWQAAYSEIYFTDKLWPDFSSEDLHKALTYFSTRERRFGKTSEQVISSSARGSR